MSSNSIHKTYSTIYELPTEVRSSFDETDQQKWLDIYLKELGDGSSEDAIKNAREQAWLQMMDAPSGLAVETWGSVEVKDWDNEVVTIDDLAAHCDDFISHGGRINDVHTNLGVGSCWKWERAVNEETGKDGIKFWFNIYRDTETTERAREEILEGVKNMVSIGAEAPRGEYKCDDRGCYVERNVTDFYELSICECGANPGANFIAINGENIAKSRHHNKGDIVFKLKEMTVHEDYTTCPIQNIKRNLIKSGIKDTHIGKDNHITTKGITRSQLLKVLKESDATCKYRETSPGVYEIKVSKSVKKSDSYYREAFWKLINDIDDMDIEDKRILNMALSDHLPDNINALKSMLLKCYENGWDGHYLASTHKSVKKSDSAMYEQLDDMIGMILSATEDIKIYIRDGDFSTACGYANSLVETAQELEGALCNIRGEKSTRKSIKKSYNVADLDEHADYVKNFIDGMVETVKDGEYEYALEDARYLPESVGLFENIIQSIASDKSASTRKSVKKEMEGWDYESLHEIYKLLNYHLHSRVHPLIDAKMYAPTTESFINSVEEVMDDYQAQFRQSMKKELFWSSDNGDKYDADGCTVEYNEDTDGYTATIYGNGDSDKIIREFDTLQDAQRFCEDYCEKSVRKSSLAIYNLLAFMDERLDGNDKEILDYVLEKNGVHSVYQLKLALEEAYDKRYEDEQAHRDDLTESTRKSIKKTSVKKDHPYGNEHVRAIEAVLDEIYRTNIGEFNTYRLGYVNFDEGYQYVNIGGSIPAESIGKILRDEYGIDASAEIYGAIAIEMNSNGLNEYMDKSLHKDIGKDIDTNADIQQYIDEAIANGWAYESNKCVYLQKEVSEAFFKDMYDKGYLQCVSGYWGFRNEIIAKLTDNEQDIYNTIKSKYTVKSHDKIKAKVLKSGYTEREFANVICYINKDGGSAGASGGSGSMGVSSAGACNTIYGKKPKSLKDKKKSDRKELVKSFRPHQSVKKSDGQYILSVAHEGQEGGIEHYNNFSSAVNQLNLNSLFYSFKGGRVEYEGDVVAHIDGDGLHFKEGWEDRYNPDEIELSKSANTIVKRCPNGYHKDPKTGQCIDANGNVYQPKTEQPKEDQSNGNDPEDNKKEPKSEKPKGKKLTEVKQRVAPDSDIGKAILTAGESEESRQKIVDYVKEHMNGENYEVPFVDLTPFQLMETANGKYLDANTFTSDIFTTIEKREDGTEVRVYTEERRKLHKQIADNIFAKLTKPKSGKPTVVFLGGGSGAGKGGISDVLKSDECDFARIDPDEIMRQLPTYPKLISSDPTVAAANCHNEASEIAKQVFEKAIAEGYNVVYDGTFSSDKPVRWLREIKAGDKHNLRFYGVRKDPDKCFEGCMQRFISTGRFVPPGIIYKSNAGFEKNIANEEIMSLFDHVGIYDALAGYKQVNKSIYTYNYIQFRGETLKKQEEAKKDWEPDYLMTRKDYKKWYGVEPNDGVEEEKEDDE